MKRTILILLLLLLAGCDQTAIDEINPYSGRWVIAFKDNSGNIVREGKFTLQDNGNICSKIEASATGDSLYFQGNVSCDGGLTGMFGDSCSVNNSGSVSGNLTELLGIITGTGNWNDTTGSTVSGIWEARRL